MDVELVCPSFADGKFSDLGERPMALYQATNNGANMMNLFYWKFHFPAINSITTLSGPSGAATAVEISNVASGVRVDYAGGASMAWFGTTPISGTYTSMSSAVGLTIDGTLTGFGAATFSNLDLTGDSVLAGDDILLGGTGNDILYGGTSGHDVFVGGNGGDRFVITTGEFTNLSEFYGGSGLDTIDIAFASGGQVSN